MPRNLMILVPLTVQDLAQMTGVSVATMVADLTFRLQFRGGLLSVLGDREVEFLAGLYGWNVIIKEAR